MVLEILGAEQIYKGDADNLYKIINLLDKAGVYAEIGTWVGHSTVLLALAAKQTGGQVYTCDTFDGTGSILSGAFTKAQIMEVLMRNLKIADVEDVVHICEERSDEAATCFEDGAIDFLFIDGDHRYEQVKKDIELWKPKVRGIIAGHDYDMPVYNEKYINEDCVEQVHHGLIKAVNEAFPDVKNEGRIWYVDLRVPA